MEIKIPNRLFSTNHNDVVKRILKLNPQLHKPQRAAWPQGLPDLEEPISRQVIDIEFRNLTAAWKRCIYYSRLGAAKIHLILEPKLFEAYIKNKGWYLEAYPLSNIEVYTLPHVKQKDKRLKNKIKKIFVSNDIQEDKVNLTLKDRDKWNLALGLVPVLSPHGDRSYITKKECEKSKNGSNYWRPFKK